MKVWAITVVDRDCWREPSTVLYATKEAMEAGVIGDAQEMWASDPKPDYEKPVTFEQAVSVLGYNDPCYDTSAVWDEMGVRG